MKNIRVLRASYENTFERCLLGVQWEHSHALCCTD
jgi:hypothetical protein